MSTNPPFVTSLRVLRLYKELFAIKKKNKEGRECIFEKYRKNSNFLCLCYTYNRTCDSKTRTNLVLFALIHPRSYVKFITKSKSVSEFRSTLSRVSIVRNDLVYVTI